MSDDRYVVDVILHSPGELEMVLRDELPRLPGQRTPDVYFRRFIGIRREGLVIHRDVSVRPVDEEHRQKFEDLTQRLYEDQHHKLFPDLEN